MRRTVVRTVLALTAGVALLLPGQGAAPPAAAAPKPANGGFTNGLIAYAATGGASGSLPGWVLVRPDGSESTFVPLPGWAVPDAQSGGVDWSPDGTELAFTATVDSATSPLRPAILLGEASGAQRYFWWTTNWDEATASEGDFDPSWTASGDALVYTRVLAGSVIARTWAEGTKPKALTAGPDGDPDMAVTGDLAFTRYQWLGGPVDGVWVDPAGSAPAEKVVDGGREPAFSPDGTRLAYVADVGRYSQLFTADVDGTDVVQVTTVEGQHTAPEWSPDGTTLAFSNGNGVWLVPANGGVERQIDSGIWGNEPIKPSWQPVPTTPEPVVRLAGANREGTAVTISQAAFPATGSADAVVLARSDTYPDALAGAPLAVAKEGPLLLTPPTTLVPAVAAEIDRVLDPAGSRTVYLLGGTGALSTSVENAVKAAGWTTRRLAGASRFDTAVAIANAVGPADEVLLATGINFPDAMSAGAAAGSYDVPGGGGGGGVVLLTSGSVLPAATRTYLQNHPDAFVTTVGGQAAKAYPSADLELIGANREETAELVALAHFGAALGAGVATGLQFPDAMAAGPLLAVHNFPLLLSAPTSLPGPTQEYLGVFSGSVNQAYVFGGPAVVSNAVQAKIGTTIGLSWTATPTAGQLGTRAPAPKGAPSTNLLGVSRRP